MNEYVISREELRKWCSVPVDELGTHPDRKMELMMGEDKAALLEEIGNMITDEVIANNAAGKNTVWILPGGIGKVYDVFIRRVNEERISLKICMCSTWTSGWTGNTVYSPPPPALQHEGKNASVLLRED